MAQVIVNFRLEEDIKKSMEQACREMGLSMSAAFTIFAKKVGSEKRIPFEVTAEPQRSRPRPQPGPTRPDGGEEAALLMQRQKRLELLCADVRRSLTAIHTAIPSAITGLSMERIRLLCGDELKDKAAGTASASRSLFSSRNAELLQQKDISLLDEYIHDLSSISEELLSVEQTLIPAMKTGSQENPASFEPYVQRLSAVSQRFDGLAPLMQRFLCSSASSSGARAVRVRIRQAALPVKTPYVLSALENLEASILRHYDTLEEQTQARLESDYLPTLEMTLWDLSQTEQSGGDAGGKAALCLRAVNVLSQVISSSQQARKEWSDRRMEAEVAALERLAAMRGDIAGSIKPES